MELYTQSIKIVSAKKRSQNTGSILIVTLVTLAALSLILLSCFERVKGSIKATALLREVLNQQFKGEECSDCRKPLLLNSSEEKSLFQLAKIFQAPRKCPADTTLTRKSNYTCDSLQAGSQAVAGNLILENPLTLEEPTTIAATGDIIINELVINDTATLIAGGDVNITKLTNLSGAIQAISLSGDVSLIATSGTVKIYSRHRQDAELPLVIPSFLLGMTKRPLKES